MSEIRDLNQLLKRAVDIWGNDPAYVFKDERLTFAEFGKRVEALAAAFWALGLKKNDTCALVMRNSPAFVISYFALMRIGAVAVPVNFLLKSEELRYIFQDAGLKAVVTSQMFYAGVKSAVKDLPGFKHLIATGFISLPEGALSLDKLIASGASRAAEPVNPEDTAMILYTSGTTGKPKGAMLTHKNLTANVVQCVAATELKQKDRFLCLLPMFHSFAWTTCVLTPMAIGGRCVIVESLQPFSNVMKIIWKEKTSIFVGVPPIFAALTRVPFWRPLKIFLPIRACISGAAPLPAQVLQDFEKKFGIPLLEGYGLTEASPVVSLNPWRGPRKHHSVGLPLPGVQVRIVDDTGKDLKRNEVGEILVKGANVMKGYFKLPDATREVMTQDGWLLTGDLGKLDDEGYLFIVDRKKDLIIVKGLNVYPLEIEEILMAHEAVNEAAVIGIDDGTGNEIIRGYVTLKEGKTVEKQELLKLCRASLAPYKIPRDIEIRKELPKNTLGKILKKDLRREAKLS